MEYCKIEKKKLKIIAFERKIELVIVNGLEIELNCQVEQIGNKMTIWINKK